MFIFRVQTIALLFLGSQRSIANPTLPHPLEMTTITEEPHNHVVPQTDVLQTIDEKEKEVGQKHHWDCTAESDYIQEQIALTTTMLNEGEKITQKQKDFSTDETVLVLGKAGSGKTSLVQFLTQNPKLQSKKVRTETGEYIIDDGEKIGTSATESFTLYPELVNYNSSINFCDSPGFHDSRSSAHEIVSMDTMKSITKRFKKVKILLLEQQGSLQYGVLKDSFINTLQHLNDFVVDINRYRNHIALIATKIPFTFKMTDDSTATPEFITEEMHIDSIMEYLNHTETSLTEKLIKKNSKNEKEFYQKAIRLLQSLQTKDENGKPTRISVFRRPYKSGPLQSMPLLNNNRESLYKTIMNLDFVEVRKNDFDFTLSDKAKLYLECLLKLASDNYKNKINELSFKLNDYISQKTQNYTSFYQILSDLDSLHGALKHLSGNLDETRNYNEFFEKVYSFISDQKIPLQYNYNERIHVLEKYEEMLLKFVDTSMVFIPSSWTLPIRHVIKSAEDELKWYRTLNKLIGGLSSFETQKKKTEIHTTILHENTTSMDNLISLFMGKTGSTDLKQLFIDAQADTRKRSEIKTITNTLLQHSNITCDANGRLIVKGFQIRLSEINSEDLVHSHCNNITVKEVALLAVDTLFLDEDTVGLFKEVSMFIAAPKWEVIGLRRIVLSGQSGPKISENPYVDNSKDGKPGLPGGNGGSFFGIGLQFFNGNNLYIESNGGAGGPGADGAKGVRGGDGMNASEKLKLGVYNQSFTFTKGFETDFLSTSVQRLSETGNAQLFEVQPFNTRCQYLRTEIQLVREEGDCGINGGLGGFGGEAGVGGLPGEQELIELSDSSKIKLESQNGSMGTRGSMGEAGDRGMDGIGMVCVKVELHNRYIYSRIKLYWSCQSTNSTSPACSMCHKLDQTVEYQYTTKGIEHPAPKKSPDFSYYLLDYAVLLKAHTNHTIFNKIITDFKEGIQKKFSYNLNEMGLLFFQNSK